MCCRKHNRRSNLEIEHLQDENHLLRQRIAALASPANPPTVANEVRAFGCRVTTPSPGALTIAWRPGVV
jgi:hypothetical protein